MFTGIIETLGEVRSMRQEGSNTHFTINSILSPELQIDQSVSHNGVCLTVVDNDKTNNIYTVTAIEETLIKSSLGSLSIGDKVNLERCVKIGSRLDGHMVQGHVDCTATCSSIIEKSGSWHFVFDLNSSHKGLIVNKGSITVNGVSLTVVRESDRQFEVAIIPYTFEHTQFHSLNPGSKVNIEFDILGKYVQSMLKLNP